MKIRYMTLVLLVAAFSGVKPVSAAAPGFSIHNKAKQRIYVDVNNDRSFLDKAKAFVMTEADGVGPDRFLDKNINLNKETIITIYDKSNNVLSKVKVPGNGKTIYINYNPGNSPVVYPQRGPLMGLTGKTDTGYSLKNNVEQKSIIPIK